MPYAKLSPYAALFRLVSNKTAPFVPSLSPPLFIILEYLRYRQIYRWILFKIYYRTLYECDFYQIPNNVFGFKFGNIFSSSTANLESMRMYVCVCVCNAHKYYYIFKYLLQWNVKFCWFLCFAYLFNNICDVTSWLRSHEKCDWHFLSHIFVVFHAHTAYAGCNGIWYIFWISQIKSYPISNIL